MYLTKEKFLSYVEEKWNLDLRNLSLGKVSKKVVQWAIGEGELVTCDYCSEKGEETSKSNETRRPFEKHVVITDNRVLEFKIDMTELKYQTLFLLDEIKSIEQAFPLRVENNKFEFVNPSPEIIMHLEEKQEPKSFRCSSNSEEYEKFAIALVSQFSKRKKAKKK